MMAFTWCKPRRPDGGGMTPLAVGDLVGVVDAWERGELQDLKGQPLGGWPLAAVALHRWLLDPELAPLEHRRRTEAQHHELAADIAALEHRGIRVRGEGGVLAWEIRLYPSEDGTQPSPEYVTPETVSGREAKRANIKGNTLSDGVFPIRRGPERLAVTAEAVLGLHRQGFGVKTIAAMLGVSHMTVCRRLREAEQGRML